MSANSKAGLSYARLLIAWLSPDTKQTALDVAHGIENCILLPEKVVQLPEKLKTSWIKADDC